jgi:hypothetical protein
MVAVHDSSLSMVESLVRTIGYLLTAYQLLPLHSEIWGSPFVEGKCHSHLGSDAVRGFCPEDGNSESFRRVGTLLLNNNVASYARQDEKLAFCEDKKNGEEAGVSDVKLISLYSRGLTEKNWHRPQPWRQVFKSRFEAGISEYKSCNNVMRRANGYSERLKNGVGV